MWLRIFSYFRDKQVQGDARSGPLQNIWWMNQLHRAYQKESAAMALHKYNCIIRINLNGKVGGTMATMFPDIDPASIANSAERRFYQVALALPHAMRASYSTG